MTRKHALALLVASTALTTAVGIPALGALPDSGRNDLTAAAGRIAGAPSDDLLLLASDDDDDDHRRNRRASDDDECDDDDDCGGSGVAPAPAGSGTPPQNGLFGTGAPPQVKVN
jgi:hypothetical protein